MEVHGQLIASRNAAKGVIATSSLTYWTGMMGQRGVCYTVNVNSRTQIERTRITTIKYGRRNAMKKK